MVKKYWVWSNQSWGKTLLAWIFCWSTVIRPSLGHNGVGIWFRPKGSVTWQRTWAICPNQQNVDHGSRRWPSVTHGINFSIFRLVVIPSGMRLVLTNAYDTISRTERCDPTFESQLKWRGKTRWSNESRAASYKIFLPSAVRPTFERMSIDRTRIFGRNAC